MADNRVLMVSVQAAHPKLCERVAENYPRYKYYFRASMNSFHLGEVGFAGLGIAKNKLKEALKIEKPRVALLFEKAVWADPIIENCQKSSTKFGIEVVRVGRYSATATDLTPDLTAVKAAGAHVIISGGAGPSATTLSKQWGELKIPAFMISLSTPAMEKPHWGATGGGCKYESGHVNIGRVEITPKTIPFWDKYVKHVNDYPTSGGGVSAYDGLFILKEAIERAGSLDSDALVEAMEKTDYPGAYGRYGFFPRNHKWTHDLIWGPRHIPHTVFQWVAADNRATIWPDGRALWGDKQWEGVRPKGTVEGELQPWLIEYWKGKK